MMKKITFLLLSLLLVFAAKAQITITRNDMPNAGDSVLVSLSNTIGTLDATLTGPNYTWDYSTLTYNSQQEVKFDNPFSFPTIYAILFNIFNTSYGRENRNLTGLPVLNITAAYDFLKESTSDLRQVGAGYTIGGTPLPFLYTSADIIFKFPMNFGNTDSSDYQFGLPIPTIGYYGETGHRVNLVDGWGTLITPYNTYQTLRVKSVISSVDTLYVSALTFGSNITRPLRVEYKWLAAGKQIPVLEIDGTQLGNNFTITNVAYQDIHHSGAGITEYSTGNFNASLIPNPAAENTILQYSLSAESSIKIGITDVLGKTITVFDEGTQANGIHLKAINTSDLNLTKGIYFVTIQSNNAKEVTKLVIE